MDQGIFQKRLKQEFVDLQAPGSRFYIHIIRKRMIKPDLLKLQILQKPPDLALYGYHLIHIIHGVPQDIRQPVQLFAHIPAVFPYGKPVDGINGIKQKMRIDLKLHGLQLCFAGSFGDLHNMLILPPVLLQKVSDQGQHPVHRLPDHLDFIAAVDIHADIQMLLVHLIHPPCHPLQRAHKPPAQEECPEQRSYQNQQDRDKRTEPEGIQIPVQKPVIHNIQKLQVKVIHIRHREKIVALPHTFSILQSRQVDVLIFRNTGKGIPARHIPGTDQMICPVQKKLIRVQKCMGGRIIDLPADF